MRPVSLAFLAMMLSLGAAQADSTSDTVAKFGLIGEWAIDCTVDPGPNLKGRLKYTIGKKGDIVHIRNFGDRTATDYVKSARITPEGWLELKVYFPELEKGAQNRTFALAKQPDGTLRAMYNRAENGDRTIVDGKFTANGNDTPKQTKCN